MCGRELEASMQLGGNKSRRVYLQDEGWVMLAS